MTPAERQRARRERLRQSQPPKEPAKRGPASGPDSAALAAARAEIARLKAELDAKPVIDAKALSMTAQEKLEAAMRHRQKLQDQQFERRVQDEVKRRIDDIVLPHWKQKIDEAHRIYARRKGVMDKATYTKIRACLHVDRLAQLIDVPAAKLDANLAKRYNEAFNLFESLEKHLLDEKASPSHIGDLPANLDEWDRLKRTAATARKAGRTNVSRR